MTLPRQFELVVVPAPAVAGGMVHMTGAMNTAGDIQTLQAQVSAAMGATDAAVGACAGMTATDRTTWQGLYSGWQAWNQTLSGCLSSVPATQYAPPDVQCISSFGINWGSAYSKLQGYQQDTATWQNRVKAACPSYQPSPTPAPPGPQGPSSPSTPGGGGAPPAVPSWLCSTFGIGCGGAASPASQTTWADAIKWSAILGLGLVAAWYVGPLIATVAGVGAGAIRKRAAHSDEFEPVDVRGAQGYGNMMSIAPQLDPLQFGDVPRDDVLALLMSGQE